jgi:branched-chain amino acid aminotransferase
MRGGETLDFEIRPNPAPVAAAERAALMANPGFGRVFTDHMVTVRWAEGKGWYDARVEARAPIPMDPASAVLHYAQEVFEGLKAYRHADGSIWTFRPEQNAARMQRSAKRLAMPELPTEYFLDSLAQLIALDGDWVPTQPETSLYLRPFMFAKEAFLGVRPAKKVNYYLIASPAGAYFTGGITPLAIWLSTNYTRAGHGGMGQAKTGGNYAASLVAQQEAYENGCQQVLFLDAQKGEYLEELGGMNVVLVTRDNRLITPDSDSILEGITLDSILQLGRDRGYTIEQRPVSITEWRDGVESGEIVEAFACGTAAVITPISEIKSASFGIWMPEVENRVSMSLREELTGIQYGRVEDRHGWLRRLDA